jgi:hypothetical protein
VEPGFAVIGGQKMTAAEVAALVQRYGSGIAVPRGPHLAADTLTGEPPLLSSEAAQRLVEPGFAVIGGQKMTAAEVAALRKRLASPMPTAGPDDT